MRAIQSERKSRRRTRRPQEDCIIARSTASIARLYVPCRRPRKPFARFTALRFVFNFGILRVLPGALRKSGALYTRRPEASSLRRLCPRGGHGSGLPHRSSRAGAGLPGRRRPDLRWSRRMGGRGRSSLGALRLQPARIGRENHEQQAALEPGRLLDDGDVLQVLGTAGEDRLTDLAVGDLAPAEHHRAARLVPLFEELADGLRLEPVIVLFGLRTDLHFLELHHRLLLLRLAGFLLRLVLELAVVHDLADRRLRHRRDLDQVEAVFSCFGEGCLEGQDTQLLSLWTDDSKFTGADSAVRTCVADGRLPGLRPC